MVNINLCLRSTMKKPCNWNRCKLIFCSWLGTIPIWTILWAASLMGRIRWLAARYSSTWILELGEDMVMRWLLKEANLVRNLQSSLWPKDNHFRIYFNKAIQTCLQRWLLKYSTILVFWLEATIRKTWTWTQQIWIIRPTPCFWTLKTSPCSLREALFSEAPRYQGLLTAVTSTIEIRVQ